VCAKLCNYATRLHGGAGVAGIAKLFLQKEIRIGKSAIDISIEIASVDDAI
jgi:hypothetical protein